MKFLLTATLVLFTFLASGQEYLVHGKVVDVFGKPIPNVVIFVLGTTQRIQSGQEGNFELLFKQKEHYTISAFAETYQSYQTELQLTSNQTEFQITLQDLFQELDEVEVVATQNGTSDIAHLPAVVGAAIYEAKKSEVVYIDKLLANKSTGNARQVFGKIAGINVWESDGAALQLGIGGRGLSPNRTSNFNTRQNGYDISADALGYPESYYTPPIDALKKIEVVRGASSLQYGTQFGGMLNFVMKRGPRENRPLEVLVKQTIGSYKYFGSFNSLTGKVGKADYNITYQRKEGNGWRHNSKFFANTLFADFNIDITQKLFICFEYSHYDYLSQQPGGLNQSAFDDNPRQSFKKHGWFKVNWNVFANILEYKFSNKTKINSKTFGLVSSRKSLGNLDPFYTKTNNHLSRTLIDGRFNNFGNETRLIHHYFLRNQLSTLLIGTRYYTGHTVQNQGDPENEIGKNFSFKNPNNLENSSFTFPSRNAALFVENIFSITNKVTITPGFRWEYIYTAADGYYKAKENQNPLTGEYTSIRTVPERKHLQRQLYLFGIGVSYKPLEDWELYTNISQNYRAINFNDIRTENPNLQLDPDLNDENGFSADLGFRGQNSFLRLDLSLFLIHYNNRIGLAYQKKDNGLGYVNLRKNIGSAVITGIESLVEFKILKYINPAFQSDLSLFTNIALINGKYTHNAEDLHKGKNLEFVPAINLRSGIQYVYRGFKASMQISYTGHQFTDASNAERENGQATIGKIPAYHVLDFSLSYEWRRSLLEFTANNLTNNPYFTRRATGYPGPGIIPADGSTFYLTFGLKF